MLCIVASKLVVVLSAPTQLLDHPRFGRRPLLLTSNLGMAMALALLSVNYFLLSKGEDHDAAAIAVAALVLFSVFLNVGSRCLFCVVSLANWRCSLIRSRVLIPHFSFLCGERINQSKN